MSHYIGATGLDIFDDAIDTAIMDATTSLTTLINAVATQDNLNAIYSSNYTDKVGIFGSNYSDLVGYNSSNYTDKICNFTSNYIKITSNILVQRIKALEGSEGSPGDPNADPPIPPVPPTGNYALAAAVITLTAASISGGVTAITLINNLTGVVNNNAIYGSNYSDKVGVWSSNYAYDKVGMYSSNYAYDKVGMYSSNYAYNKVGMYSSNYAYDKVGMYSSNYSDKVGVWSSNYSDKVGVWSSNYSDKVGVFGSNYSDKVGIYGSNYTDKVGVFGSNYTDKVGVYTSNYTDKIGVYSSNYSDKVGVWSSNYSDKVGVYTSNYTDKIGVYSSNYSDKVGVFGSNYSDKVGIWGSNYAYDKIGMYSSNYSDKVGVWSSNYAYDKVGMYSSNYTDKADIWGSNFARDKVGVWSSNYSEKIGVYSSNYTERLIAGLGTNTNYWTTDGATNIYLNQAGNVGIGTQTSLTNKLQVQGTASVSGLLSVQGGITAGASSLITANNGIVVNTGSLTCVNDTYSKTYIATSATTGTSDISTMRYDTRNGIRFQQRYIGVDDVRYDLIQKVANVDKTASLSFYNGNVGIGRTDPTNILQVGGNRVRISNGSSDYTIIGTSDAPDFHTRIFMAGINYTDSVNGGTGNICYLSGNGGKHIFFTQTTTTETERMRIGNNGNVSIGTTDTATYKLRVEGSQYINNQLQWSTRYRPSDNFPCNKICLYGNLNQFGFGIDDNTLDYFSASVHRWFNGTPASSSSYGNERMKIWDNGAVSIQSSGYALPTNINYMRAGSVVIGNINANYGWGQYWNAGTTGTAGLLLECSDYTEIAVHDSGARIVSFLAYYNNLITIGRNMGYGVTNLNCEGFIAFGTSAAPSYILDVPTNGSGNSGYYNMRYFDVNNVLSYAYTYLGNVSARIGGSLWCGSWIASSSDARIKEDIQDINDDTALNMILAIEPKTYKYIDKVAKGDKKVYGFIAQQIRQVLPDAIGIEPSYIPNIMLLADYDNEIITLPSQPTKVIIKLNDKIRCYDKDNKTVDVIVIEVIDEITFKIKHNSTSKDFIYTDNKIFVSGTEVDDFHTISKEYIFTLNVCATQELHRRIEAQNVRIRELEEKMADILGRFA